MLTKDDIRGVSIMIPTPCIEGGDHWSVTNSVDLEESARMTENIISAGIGVISACGTTGEGHSLLWEEKVAFIDTLVQINRHRVPIFAGATALGTRETIRQMRAFKDMGAEGAFVGLPLWQTPTIRNSVDFYADLSEAVPDMAIMVYANPMFFKSTFPTIFWEGVANNAPTVITNKIGAAPMIENLAANIKVSGHQIAHLPAENSAPLAHQLIGDALHGFWSTAASMGPEPSVALWKAIEKSDANRIEEIMNDRANLPRPGSIGNPDLPSTFPMFNTQAEKARMNASGYIKAGPTRPPYHHPLPPEQLEAAEIAGKGWAEMRKKYM